RYISKCSIGSRVGRIDQHGNANRLGHQLVQKCQPLRSQLSHEKIDARQISARPGEAVDKTELDRVFADTKDYRDRCGRSLGGKRSSVAGGRRRYGGTTEPQGSPERPEAVRF